MGILMEAGIAPPALPKPKSSNFYRHNQMALEQQRNKDKNKNK